MSFSASTSSERDEKHRFTGRRGPPETFNVQTLTYLQYRIILNELMYQRKVLGMQFLKLLLRFHNPSMLRVTERCATVMTYENITYQDVPPTSFCGATTEIILFAVSTPEVFDIKQPNFRDAGSTDEHAETYACWNLH
ncbi:hypothetical protein BB934_05215 [Microvirga ossetica]|uniref:Uncharacterized protein n=1 Tax=Microvirga ossetica TaxID=1882682 RepID=A0A1B2ECI5_9HYPH|nr:hypothetical protein BB934_05215 [Microvirga ossetica]